MFPALNCTVTIAHTQVTCITAEGVGFNHLWKVGSGAGVLVFADVVCLFCHVRVYGPILVGGRPVGRHP